MTFNGTNLRTHTCPNCKKFRLYWPLGEIPSQDTEIRLLPDGTQMAFFKNVCEFCKIKIQNKYFKTENLDMKKVLKAIKDGKTEKSLEELL